jgi:hypothetical protein
MGEQEKPGPREEFEGEEGGIGEDTRQGGGQSAIGGQGGEGEGAANLAPEIDEEGEPGQTQVDAPDDDASKGEDEGSRTDH